MTEIRASISPGQVEQAALVSVASRVAVPAERQRYCRINGLKGLCIIGVMAQHAFSPAVLARSWDSLHVGQAVPIFFILMALNASASLTRRGVTSLRSAYDVRYVVGRFDRLVVPVIGLWPLALIAGVIVGDAHIGPLDLVGVLPLRDAPGNYFVTVAVEFAIVFPGLFLFFRRAPVVISIVVLLGNVAFELAADHVSGFSSSVGAVGFVYEAAIIKYAVFVVAGLWIQRRWYRAPSWALLTCAAALSVAYLCWLHQDPGDFTWLVASFSRTTNFLSAAYAIWLLQLGLRWLPTSVGWRPWAIIEELGRASYHIFLIQIPVFGVVTNRSWAVAVGGMVFASVLGCGYARVSLPSVSKLAGPYLRRRTWHKPR